MSYNLTTYDKNIFNSAYHTKRMLLVSLNSCFDVIIQRVCILLCLRLLIQTFNFTAWIKSRSAYDISYQSTVNTSRAVYLLQE
jgi:hypothetical protein